MNDEEGPIEVDLELLEFRAVSAVRLEQLMERGRARFDDGVVSSDSRRHYARAALLLPLGAVISVVALVLAVVDGGAPGVGVTEIGVNSEPRTVYGDALMAFSQERPADVVARADHVVLAKVTDVEPAKGEMSESRAYENGGLITNDVTFVVGRTIWTTKGAGEPPKSLVVSHGGFVYTSVNDGPKIKSPFAYDGGIVYKPGQSYAVPLGRYRGSPETAIFPLAEFAYQDGRIVLGRTQESALAKRLAGMTADQVGAVFEQAES